MLGKISGHVHGWTVKEVCNGPPLAYTKVERHTSHHRCGPVVADLVELTMKRTAALLKAEHLRTNDKSDQSISNFREGVLKTLERASRQGLSGTGPLSGPQLVSSWRSQSHSGTSRGASMNIGYDTTIHIPLTNGKRLVVNLLYQ